MINELASEAAAHQLGAGPVPGEAFANLRLLLCLFFFVISFQKCFHGVKTFRVENAFSSSLFGISLSDADGARSPEGRGRPAPVASLP